MGGWSERGRKRTFNVQRSTLNAQRSTLKSEVLYGREAEEKRLIRTRGVALQMERRCPPLGF